MTDITRLTQEMKAAAHKAKQANDLYLEGKITLSECVVETKDYLDYSDNPNNFLALVEALDKSEKTSEARREAIDRTHNMFVRERDRANAAEEALEKAQRANAAQGDHIEQQQDRIEQLEKGNQYAAKRIAELESRTVTVKLPQAVSAGGQGYQAQVERILTAAGIKWGAE
ncbi:ead/Ea22-like family protein [Klebsiella michiganensis]|nr:ead/Ea22-like family protein [Klebsiella michiganensis]